MLENNSINTQPIECKVLNLCSDKLQNLPEGVFELISLERLYINENSLTVLPQAFASLKNLKRFYASQNKLNAIHPQITKLMNLTEIDLSFNQIKIIPTHIKRLNNLKELYLDGNKITQVPIEIANLENLEVLALSKNEITALPKEILKLTKLRKLYINDTLIPVDKSVLLTNDPALILSSFFKIPQEIYEKIKNNPEKLIEYVDRIQKEKKEAESNQPKALLEGRIIIIGNGNVGKTSLKQKLTGQKLKSVGKTEGVEINKWQTTIRNEEVNLNIWDFGGQEIYHTTHQFFFRSRCLYILVIDARLGERGSLMNFWLRQIRALGKDAPIIIVVNKAEVENEESREIDKNYERILDEIKNLKNNHYPNIVGFKLISCLRDLQIHELKNLVNETIDKHLPEVFYPVPSKWFRLKQELERNNKNYISNKEFEKLCNKFEIGNDEEINELSTILDILGITTCFQDYELKDMKLLKPEWITKGIYKILSSYKLSENEGKIRPQDINSIFVNEKEYPLEKLNSIIKIMKEFSLCTTINESGKESLLFPVWLPIQEAKYSPFVSNSTYFEFSYTDIFFESIITRFIIEAQRESGTNNYWRTGVIFRKTNNRALVKADSETNTISIKIEGKNETRGDLLDEIINRFEKIHENYFGLKIEKKIIHPKLPEICFDYEMIKNREKLGEGFVSYQDKKGKDLEIPISYLLQGTENKNLLSKKETSKFEEKIKIQEEVLAKLANLARTFTKYIEIFIISFVIGIVLYFASWVKEYWDFIEPYKEVMAVVTGLLLIMITKLFGKTLWNILDETLFNLITKLLYKLSEFNTVENNIFNND